MTPATARRKRRRAKAKLLHGDKAVRRHAKRGGRTGRVHAKKTRGHASFFAHFFPNAPWQSRVEWMA